MKNHVIYCLMASAVFVGLSSYAHASISYASEITKEVFAQLEEEGSLDGLSDDQLDTIYFETKNALAANFEGLNLTENTSHGFLAGLVQAIGEGAVRAVGSAAKAGIKKVKKTVGQAKEAVKETVGKVKEAAQKTTESILRAKEKVEGAEEPKPTKPKFLEGVDFSKLREFLKQKTSR